MISKITVLFSSLFIYQQVSLMYVVILVNRTDSKIINGALIHAHKFNCSGFRLFPFVSLCQFYQKKTKNQQAQFVLFSPIRGDFCEYRCCMGQLLKEGSKLGEGNGYNFYTTLAICVDRSCAR